MHLRLQARYSLVFVSLLAVVVGLIVGLHLLESRAMFNTTSRTYSEVATSALFKQIRKEGEGMARFLAGALVDPVYRLEVDRIRDVVAAARANENVLYVAVYNAKDQPLAENPPGSARRGPKPTAPDARGAIERGEVITIIGRDELTVIAPIMSGRRFIGCIKIGLSLVEVNAEIGILRAAIGEITAVSQRRFVAIYVGMAVIMVLIGFAISLFMARGLVQPIEVLGQYTRRIGAGNYDDPPPFDRADELGDLARALGQMARDLKQVAQVARLATLGEMAVGMAHELSQPLNTIRLAAENTLMAIEQGKSDVEFEKAKLALISHQAEAMGDLIKRMCVVGRSEGPQEIVDPRESVKDAYSLLAGQCEDEGIAVTLDMPDHCASVLGRRNELAQVVINLLSNARDAIIESALGRRGRLQPTNGRIEVALHDDSGDAEAGSGEIIIRVKDNGGGVPPDAIDRIFDPFFTTKDVTKGTGLGLSISYGIINAMGGRIWVENFGGGALFTIRLPAIVKPGMAKPAIVKNEK